MKNFLKSEIAVSEAVSFIQTLAIVLVSTAIIYTAGSPMLDKAEKNAHFQEMETGFIFLSQNIDRIGYDRAPIRYTELKIKGGAMTVAHNSMITIGDASFALGSLEYKYEDKTIAYENGGIWIKYPGGEVVMASKPAFSTGNTSTIPVMELLGDYYIAGEGILRVDSRFHSSEVQSINGTNGTVPIEINSSYYRGWKDYLTGIGARDIVSDNENNTVMANLSADTVNVDHNRISIRILEN